MKPSVVLAQVLGGLLASPRMAFALESGDAATMFDAFNNVFLQTSGNTQYYTSSIGSTSADGNWAASLDILMAEDAYEVTGDDDTKQLVGNLMTTWLESFGPPWDYVVFNDDLGWDTLALIRAYSFTQNASFLGAAEYGFNFAFNRGWDTVYNGGGIWESQPSDPSQGEKDALSNDSLGKVACLLYQNTHDPQYLTKCQQIYDWVWNHLYNSATGQINFGVYADGTVDTSSAAYNQGTWLDFASLLYQNTLDANVYNDAVKILNYGMNSLTVNGIFTNDQSNLNTWADDFARGLGHFVGDNRLWGDYYNWMVENANAILTNRRSDLGITWNAWDTPTDSNNHITNWFVSAVAWLQYTPVNMPDNRGGIHTIVNQLTGLAIDSAGIWGNGSDAVQWQQTGSINQHWRLTQNSDTSWNIINLSTWEALDCPGGGTDNNLTMIQWQPTRNTNQRWWVDEQSDGSYKIWNQASQKALDGASSTDNGAVLIQWDWNGGSQQRWLLQ